MDAIDDLFSSLEVPTARTWQRIYQLKNSDKDMSAFVSAHQCSSLYKACLTWLLENISRPPNQIIDLGCDNGLLTLAIGKLFPNSGILGIDSVGKAIAAAKHLRRKYQINNAEFRMADLTKPMDILDHRADLILAPWVMHDLLPCTTNGGPISQIEKTFLTNLSNFCRSGGTLISVNRFPHADRQVPVLKSCLAVAGFDPTIETTIAAEEGDQISYFPLVAFKKAA